MKHRTRVMIRAALLGTATFLGWAAFSASLSFGIYMAGRAIAVCR